MSDVEQFKYSTNDYDWLGSGTYFWEANPLRGLEFAHELKKWRETSLNPLIEPCVVGAVIDLGYCLDLLSSTGLLAVQTAYKELSGLFAIAKKQLPENERGQDLVFRHLDCAVINYTHKMIEKSSDLKSFDSVRGVFTEGDPAYPGAGFKAKTHIQLCVRNLKSIRGVFRVPKDQLTSSLHFDT